MIDNLLDKGISILMSLTGQSESTIMWGFGVIALLALANAIGAYRFRSASSWIPYKGFKQKHHLKDAVKTLGQIKDMEDDAALKHLAKMDGFTFELAVYIALIRSTSKPHYICPIKLTGDMGLDGYFGVGKQLNIIQSKCYRLDGFISTSDVDKFIRIANALPHSKSKKSVLKRTRTKEVKGIFVSTGRMPQPAINKMKQNGILSINNLAVVKLIKEGDVQWN